MEPVVRLVVLRVFDVAPLVERKRRIGDHDVELHQGVFLDQRRAAERVAPLDAGLVHAMQEHVHLAQRPGAPVGFHAVQRDIPFALGVGRHGLPHLDQQRARSAGRIADAVARLRLEQLRQQHGDFRRRVELARLLAGVGREVADQEFVGVADDVQPADPRRPQVQPGIVKIFQQVDQPGVAVLRLAQVGFAVEVDVAEDAFELAAVLVFDVGQGHVDQIADVRLRGVCCRGDRSATPPARRTVPGPGPVRPAVCRPCISA